MKNEKFCFSKGTGLIAIVGILLVGFVIANQTLTDTKTSTNSRASGVKDLVAEEGVSPTALPSMPLDETCVEPTMIPKTIGGPSVSAFSPAGWGCAACQDDFDSGRTELKEKIFKASTDRFNAVGITKASDIPNYFVSVDLNKNKRCISMNSQPAQTSPKAGLQCNTYDCLFCKNKMLPNTEAGMEKCAGTPIVCDTAKIYAPLKAAILEAETANQKGKATDAYYKEIAAQLSKVFVTVNTQTEAGSSFCMVSGAEPVLPANNTTNDGYFATELVGYCAHKALPVEDGASKGCMCTSYIRVNATGSNPKRTYKQALTENIFCKGAIQYVNDNY